MCGIVVALGSRFKECNASLKAMAHRGTEPTVRRAGCWTIGRTRLPIVGLSPEFDAPYHDKGWTFGFVGEVLNYKELITTARCDVEVLARSWRDLGAPCLHGFDGFWHVAAVEPAGNRVQVATDYLSQKPLYYRPDAHAFASEIRGLAAFGRLTPDPVYFSSIRKFGYPIGERTWANEVKKMPPGALWTVDATGELTRDDWFDVVQPDPEKGRYIGSVIEQAIRRRVLASDVPVGILLSGGLDSSIVYRVAENLRADMTIYHAPNDERDYLNMLNPKGKLVEIDMGGVAAGLDEVLRANEGPVDLGSMIPQFFLGQAVEERVALSGDGADELFGGYRRAKEYRSQGSDVYDELVHYHLPRLDKMMMWGTVELRSPFLSRDVLAGALALADAELVDKRVLREAFVDILPEGIAYGPKRPLKSDRVREDPVAWRETLIQNFMKMIERGEAT